MKILMSSSWKCNFVSDCASGLWAKYRVKAFILILKISLLIYNSNYIRETKYIWAFFWLEAGINKYFNRLCPLTPIY